jgi:hypothetical protein
MPEGETTTIVHTAGHPRPPPNTSPLLAQYLGAGLARFPQRSASDINLPQMPPELHGRRFRHGQGGACVRAQEEAPGKC